MELILLPFVANIVILIPATLSTLTGNPHGGPFAEGTGLRQIADALPLPEISGWRQLTGCLWAGILACSLLALRNPRAYWPILLLQVIYKATWLGAYVAPRLASSNPLRREEIHRGMTLSFFLVVLCWPAFIPWSQVLGNGVRDGPLYAGKGLGLVLTL